MLYLHVFSIWLCLTWIVCATSAVKLRKRCYTINTNIQTQLSQTNDLSKGHESEDDNGFELRLRRLSDGVMVDKWYEPGRKYLLILTNRFYSIDYRNAILWLSPDENENKGMDDNMGATNTISMKNESSSSSIDLGQWIHLTNSKLNQYNLSKFWSTNTIFSRTRLGCDGLTVEKNIHSDKRITNLMIIWQAPTNSKQGCVILNAAVQTHHRRLRTYSSTGGLSKTLCPSSTRPPSPVLPAYMVKQNSLVLDANEEKENGEKEGKGTMQLVNTQSMHLDSMQPDECCACGSATYKLTFAGLWTKQTHPKDWPVHNPGLLHWTNLIGASHSPTFQIYRIGERASAGIQAVCTYGDTTVIKQSLGIAASNTGSIGSFSTGTQRSALEIGPLHSLISAPGMWSEDTLDESRTTYVAVNRTHPLISFVSMLGPSPNWCTGLSSQSVCQADCTWVTKLEIDLYPWDAGSIRGDTYIPKEADRKEIPDPIRYITRDWMPNSPFTPNLPVAKVTLERVLPDKMWQCTTKLQDNVELFYSDGSTKKVGQNPLSEYHNPVVKSVIGDLTGSLPKKSRYNSGKSGPGKLGSDNPLSDPSLAQMSTFLCKMDSWSAWTPCSVTCGVGKRSKTRHMLVNKKNELCQHLPLIAQESCEGRKRTCDFSQTCSLLPWTGWTPCNATCDHRMGEQTRTRYLVRQSEQSVCQDVFQLNYEHSSSGMVWEKRNCYLKDSDCDPASICGEGRKDGLSCGKQINSYHYSAVEHACLQFTYLGCKGGRNRFGTKQACESFCLSAVEALPGWRRERLALLQYKTAQLDPSNNDLDESITIDLKAANFCDEVMDPGVYCIHGPRSSTVRWYFSSRTRRCRELDYYGCDGNENNFKTHQDCMANCLPFEMEKHRRMAKARKASMVARNFTNQQPQQNQSQQIENDKPRDLTKNEWNVINNLWGPKQDCQLSKWSGWSPCSCVLSDNKKGTQWRWRYTTKPSMHNGRPCENLFEEKECGNCE